MAKKSYRLVPSIVKMPPLELLKDKHDGETIRQFINACNTYFKLTGVKNKNTQAHFTKTRLSGTVHI